MCLKVFACLVISLFIYHCIENELVFKRERHISYKQREGDRCGFFVDRDATYSLYCDRGFVCNGATCVELKRVLPPKKEKAVVIAKRQPKSVFERVCEMFK